MFFTLFVVFNINTLFSQGGFDASGEWVDDSGEYYHKTRYNFGNDEYINFHIYGNIELKETYGPNNLDKVEYYYVLILYEPVTFTKGFGADEKTITTEEIILLFSNDNLREKIDLVWRAHIIEGKLYFFENNSHTPLIMIADRINANG
jgi:hypothetical protein